MNNNGSFDRKKPPYLTVLLKFLYNAGGIAGGAYC
jgi:hypothetical protein